MDKNHKLIIIIGLPGSGKTELSKSYITYTKFDDFISKFYNGKLIKAIQANLEICISDPRMCIPDIFDQYMEKILHWIDKSQILLILFENNPSKCLENTSKRFDNRLGIGRTIEAYSKKYCLDYYDKYLSQVIPVYCSLDQCF